MFLGSIRLTDDWENEDIVNYILSVPSAGSSEECMSLLKERALQDILASGWARDVIQRLIISIRCMEISDNMHSFQFDLCVSDSPGFGNKDVSFRWFEKTAASSLLEDAAFSGLGPLFKQ